MTKKIIVKSPANIAFIKYWGMKDEKLILPYNDSYSMNLSNCYTTVILEIGTNIKKQDLFIKDYKAKDYQKNNGDALENVIKFYNTTKKFLNSNSEFGFTIYSENSFPKKAGIASSASFFSALALAFSTAFDKKLNKNELSILARLSGSGSASRSIPDGFVKWNKGTSSETSFSKSIAKPDYWDIVDLVLILNYDEKKIGSQEGHSGAMTSPLYEGRIATLPTRISVLKKAFTQKDFSSFGLQIEADTISMHSVMMTQQQPLFYWTEKTISILKKVIQLRENKLACYYTIDAGENVHIICRRIDERKISAFFKQQEEVAEIITNHPAIGTRIVSVT